MASALVLLLGLASNSLAFIAGNMSTAINSDDFAECLTLDNGLVASNTLSMATSDVNAQSAPFTWTMGVRFNPGPDGYSEDSILIARDFYLGYNPDKNGSVRTCNIIFNDISGTGGLNYSDLSMTAIDWTQELPDDCARILTMQADNSAKEAMRNSEDVATFCARWEVNLNDVLLGSCLNADLGSNVKRGMYLVPTDPHRYFEGFLTLFDIAFTIDPSRPENCTSTSGLNYNIHLVHTQEVRYVKGDIEARSMIQGTTPVITILFPPSGSNETEPETHFLNLRPRKRLLSLVDESRANTMHPTCLIILSWTVAVFFSILEYSSEVF
ncbi:hypothetical protein BDW71DRAFT_203380 [Aspergillus fruticulosus]